MKTQRKTIQQAPQPLTLDYIDEIVRKVFAEMPYKPPMIVYGKGLEDVLKAEYLKHQNKSV